MNSKQLKLKQQRKKCESSYRYILQYVKEILEVSLKFTQPSICVNNRLSVVHCLIVLWKI